MCVCVWGAVAILAQGWNPWYPPRSSGCELRSRASQRPPQGGAVPVFESGAPSAAAADRLPTPRSCVGGIPFRRWDGIAPTAGAGTASRAGRASPTGATRTPRRRAGARGSASAATSSQGVNAKVAGKSGGTPNGSSQVVGPVGRPHGWASSRNTRPIGGKALSLRRPS